jgi:hypothetical protein
MSEIINVNNDTNIDSSNPYVMASAGNTICLNWESYLNSPDMKQSYDELTEEEKNNIQNNSKTRTCQSINNISQCFTSNGFLENCNEPQNKDDLKQALIGVNQTIDEEKNQQYAELEKNYADKSDKLTNLIKEYSSRQDMLRMNKGYHNLLDKSIVNSRKDQNTLGENLDNIDNLKNFMVENIKTVRTNQYWYEEKNKTLITVLRFSFVILILLMIIYMLSITAVWNKSI